MKNNNGGGRYLLVALLLTFTSAKSTFGFFDSAAWRAYEAVEEAWIRDRHSLLLQQAPAAINAAHVDLELRLADLHRRGLQFRHLVRQNPALFRGGVWQMSTFSVSPRDNAELMTNPVYRKLDDRVRQLGDALRRHPQYEILRRAQARLWKTPQYPEIHRLYTGRMQELHNSYSGSAQGNGSVSVGQ